MEPKIATELKIDDRIYKFHIQQVFLTIKNHKTNFQHNPQYKVISVKLVKVFLKEYADI